MATVIVFRQLIQANLRRRNRLVVTTAIMNEHTIHIDPHVINRHELQIAFIFSLVHKLSISLHRKMIIAQMPKAQISCSGSGIPCSAITEIRFDSTGAAK